MFADYIITGNKIFDGYNKNLFSGAIVISEDRIIEVINFEDNDLSDYLRYLGPETELIETKGGLVMPGFIDAHTHYFSAAIASSRYVCSELDKSSSEEDAVRIIKRFADCNPGLSRIRGRGWFITNWNRSDLPSKESLDKELPDIPVYLQAADAHSFWLNSAALEECGIDKKTAKNHEGIKVDKSGNPTGILLELDTTRLAQKYYEDFTKEERLEIYNDFQVTLNGFGVTSLSEMMPYDLCEKTYDQYHVLSEMEREGNLSARVHIYLPLFENDDLGINKTWKEKLDSDYIKISGVKGFVDGVVETYTGLLLEPYTDRPDTRGENVPFVTQERLNKAVYKANKSGIPVRIHAIADGSVRMCLDAFEYTKEKLTDNVDNTRRIINNTIEHIENIAAEDIRRFSELGVLPSMQPVHVLLDANGKISRIGEERIKLEWPLKSILDSAGEIALGTDCPVVDIDPFTNIYASVSRRFKDGSEASHNPDERLSMFETLRGYTYGAAKAYGREKELGRIKKGYLADIVIVNKNLFAISEMDILSCDIKLTMIGGKIVWRSGI
jgi:predicted amidohydrolase YtcJ